MKVAFVGEAARRGYRNGIALALAQCAGVKGIAGGRMRRTIIVGEGDGIADRYSQVCRNEFETWIDTL